jgi:hypothetical protein
MADKRINDLNALQDRLYQRLQAVEQRIRALEDGGSPSKKGKAMPLLDRKTRIDRAAWELEDAIFDRALPKSKGEGEESATQFPADLVKARNAHVEVLKAKRMYNRAILGLIILTFVEVPPWCHGKHGDAMKIWTFQSGAEWCPLPSVGGKNADPNLSGISYLPPGYAFLIEMIIEMIILNKFWKELSLEKEFFWPMGANYRQALSNLGFVFAIGSIIDTGIFMLFRVPFRLTFIFRTGLIFLLPGVQHIFWQIFNPTVMTEFGSVAIFFLGTMIFFAWIGFTVFGDDNSFSYMDGEEKILTNKGFTAFPEAINTMFVGGVTGEFIDCFLPSFNMYRLSGAVWMIYLLLTQVLFKNLVMDTLICAYLKGNSEEEEKIVEAQVSGMQATFSLLSDDGETIEKDNFIAFVSCLGKSPRWSAMPLKASEMIFDKLEEVNRKNFFNVVSLLQSEFWITERNSAYLKDKADKEWVREYVWEDADGRSGFDNLMNRVLMLNLVMVLVESGYDLMDIEEPEILDLIEIVFSFVYVGEVVVKLAVKSFSEYWSFPANRFDFGTTWLLLGTSVLKYLPIAGIKGDLSRYANILRLLRLIRILKTLKEYHQVQFMLSVITRIMTCAGEVLELMGTFFFFFCCLAVNLFGGLLHEGNEALEESEYAEKHWYILNFNDMFMAFMAWFVQILCEYVPNYADALRRTATGAGYQYGFYAGAIVLFFYITTAAIMYELLLAFTVDVFMAVKKEGDEEEDKEVEEEREEEKGEKEEMEERQAGSSSSSSSEDEFEAEEFLVLMQEKVFTENDEVVHYRIKSEAAFQEELKEKYDNILKGKGVDDPGMEAVGKAEIVKAAWLFENGVWNQQIVDNTKLEKLAKLREEKEETEDEEKQADLKKQIDTMVFQMDTFPKDVVKAREDHIRVLQAVTSFNKAIVGLIFLTLTEVPAWCHSDKAAHLTAFSWAPGTDWCRSPSPGADMKLSGIWYFPPALALVFEVAIELVILRRFILEYNMEKDHFMTIGENPGDTRYSSLTNIKVGCICAIGSLIDTAVFLIFRTPYRLTFIFRTGLLCLLPGVQRLSERIFTKQMLGQFWSVAVFFIGTVLFFAWIAVTIYKDASEVAFTMKGEDVLVNKGFEGLRSAVYTMFLAGMTEGFDDIFIPTVTSCRASAILWLIFLLLTQVLFLNLVIDAFVAAYLEGSENHMTVTAHTQAMAVYHASTLLFGDENMEKEVFMKFIEEINQSPRMRAISPNVAKAIYEQFIIKYEAINKETFCDVCSLVQNNIWVTTKNSAVEATFPGVWNSSFFKEQVYNRVWFPAEAPWFDELMDTVLLLNLIFVVSQSMGGEDSAYIPQWLHLSTFFTLIYVWEVAVKLFVKSWSTYWSLPANQFDFFTTWILFATWSLKFINIAALQEDLMRYANLLRLLRLLRVVKKLKKYPRVQFMVTTIVRMVEAAGDILALLGVVLFAFTTFSVNFFGGLLYEGNEALKGSDYEEKHWYVFNFNDVVMGYVTWFTQLLCEYSPEWADALDRTSQIGFIAWYIYPIFYIFGVAIVFEILKAFTIETYLALKEEADDESGSEEESDDGEDVFEVENGIVESLKDLLKEDNKSLHAKIYLLPALQRKIKEAYEESLEEEEDEGKEKKEKKEGSEEEGEGEGGDAEDED